MSNQIIFIAQLITSVQMGGLGLRLGDIRESGEAGDSREEEDTQWRQVVTYYTRILRTLADLEFQLLISKTTI